MKKQAKDLKNGDKIKIADGFFKISEFEMSDIGKQGKKKVRIVALDSKGEKIILVRPEDYPFETE